MHAARLARAVLAGGDEPRLSAEYSAFVTRWFEHDVAALSELYARLPEPPRWLDRSREAPRARRPTPRSTIRRAAHS